MHLARVALRGGTALAGYGRHGASMGDWRLAGGRGTGEGEGECSVRVEFDGDDDDGERRRENV